MKTLITLTNAIVYAIWLSFVFCGALPATHSGEINLTLDRTPGDSIPVLQWQGGGPDYEVSRSDSPTLVRDQVSVIGTSSQQHWIDGASGNDSYYLVQPATSAVKNVLAYGAVGDGIADDTDAIQAALFEGGSVFLPPGTYRVSSQLNIDAPTRLYGSGRGISVIRMSNPGAVTTIAVSADHVRIAELTVQGPNAAPQSYVPLEIGIRFAPSPGNSWLTDVSVEACEVRNYGFHGIQLDHVRQARVEKTRIENIGYAAVMCLSCSDVEVSRNSIEDVGPGTAGNAYGIAFTFRGEVPTSENPASTRCIADSNTVHNIPVWECLDTHNGSFITFSNNLLSDCRIGIHAGSVEGTEQAVKHITIVGNVMAAGSASHLHSGIVVAGTSTSYAYNVVVDGNALDGYGIAGNSNAGAIHAYFTGGLNVSDNTITHAAEAGIILWHHNLSFNTSGNLIQLSEWLGTPYSIRAHAGSNVGMVIGNLVQGIAVDSAASPTVDIANNY